MSTRDDDSLGGERSDGSPEGGGGLGGLVVEDLGVDDAAAVVEGGVEVAVADAAVGAGAVRGASAVHAPPAAVADRGQLLGVDMHQLTGPFALVALRWNLRCGGPGASVEAAEAGGPEDRLDALVAAGTAAAAVGAFVSR